MARGKEFRVVVATDGSSQGRAAVRAATEFPWPEPSRAHGVVARGRAVAASGWSPAVWAALEEGLERVATDARRVLQRRWPDADVSVLDKMPVEAIVAEARGAGAIVLGSRGHGAVGRLLLGSVSRGVVRRASCPTLVVKGPARLFRRFVVGLDGSPMSHRAAAFLAGLDVPRGGHVTVVRVVEPLRVGTPALMPSRVRGTLLRELAAMNAERERAARRDVEGAARSLKRAGWAVRALVRRDVPIEALLATAASARAHALVVGARGIGGVERLLLGSVAEGMLARSRVPVLVVR
jgi:nucleotide-binding universal stress UspA family protein